MGEPDSAVSAGLLGPGVWLQGPEIMSGSWCGAVPDTVGYGGLGCPKACVGLLVHRTETQLVPGQNLSCYGQTGL